MSDSSPSVFLHLLFIYLFVLHGVIQAAPSEWETLAASARQHDRVWFQLKLQETNVQTLRQYVKHAGVSVGKILARILAYQPYWIKYFQNIKYMSWFLFSFQRNSVPKAVKANMFFLCLCLCPREVSCQQLRAEAVAAGLEARRTLRSRLSGLTLLELQRLAEEVSIPTVNQSRGTLVNLLVGSLTPEEILDEAIACRTWKLLFACCGEVQDFDLESEIANFFPSPFSRRELLAFLRGVSLQDVERLKESDATCTADVQTRLSAEVQHVDSLMPCLPEDVPQSVPEACERLRQIQFPCVHRGLLGCIMACVFHGQSCDVKKAGAFFQQPSSFSFFSSKFASFG